MPLDAQGRGRFSSQTPGLYESSQLEALGTTHLFFRNVQLEYGSSECQKGGDFCSRGFLQGFLEEAPKNIFLVLILLVINN